MENYKKIAEEVVEAVGGKSNIQENSTCMTRLHLTLADKSKVDLDLLMAKSFKSSLDLARLQRLV